MSESGTDGLDPKGAGALTDATIVRAAQGQLSGELDDEVVLLSIDKGMYYSLNAVGARVWRLIAEPRSIGAIVESLTAHYAVEPAACRRDLIELLDGMIEKGLVRVGGDDAGP